MYYIHKYDDTDCYIVRIAYSRPDKPGEVFRHECSREPYEDVFNSLMRLAHEPDDVLIPADVPGRVFKLASDARVPDYEIDWLGLTLLASHKLQTAEIQIERQAAARIVQDLRFFCPKPNSPLHAS